MSGVLAASRERRSTTPDHDFGSRVKLFVLLCAGAALIILSFENRALASPTPTPIPTPALTRWEYTWVKLTPGTVEEHDALAARGDQGWELIAVVPLRTHEEIKKSNSYGEPPEKSQVTDVAWYYFKRRLPGG